MGAVNHAAHSVWVARTTRQPPATPIRRRASQVKPASFAGIPQISPVAGSSTQHKRGGEGSQAGTRFQSQDVQSPDARGYHQNTLPHQPGPPPPPHRSYQRPLDSVLPGQCRALNAICRFSQQGFAGRRPGAQPQPSPVVFPPGPKIQAPASSDLLIIPGPGKSPPQRVLRTLLAGRAQHTPAGDPEIGRPKRASQPEARRGPDGRRPQQLCIPERWGGARPKAAADQASRSSPALPTPLPLGREQPQRLSSPTRTVRVSARG
ncbi:hypothetical protein NDU88_006195 [Pleurodeles waltl]|uniref:Uncharacterized protein n=1 Tax=Pleurodeles waltl TaxID=8319 RepID=A0AAV7TD75_PLEWA|nr:hypothetical protein NDU88_006195 [Pleurodeles waltl]